MPNTIQVYYKDKYKDRISALRKKAEESDESESRLFLELLFIGAKQKFPEIMNGNGKKEKHSDT